MRKKFHKELWVVAVIASLATIVIYGGVFFGPPNWADFVRRFTAGHYGLWPAVAFYTIVEIRTRLYAMRRGAVLTLCLAEPVLGLFAITNQTSAAAEYGVTLLKLQGLWLIAVPIVLGGVLHFGRPALRRKETYLCESCSSSSSS